MCGRKVATITDALCTESSRYAHGKQDICDQIYWSQLQRNEILDEEQVPAIGTSYLVPGNLKRREEGVQRIGG